MKQTNYLYRNYYLFISVLYFYISCNPESIDPITTINRFYYTNSFETETDLKDWKIQTENAYIVDSFVGAFGKHSVLIFGGCFYPHYAKQFGPFDHDIKLNISLIGKIYGGQLAFSQLDNDPDCVLKKYIFFNSNNWQEYHFKEDIRVPSNSRFEISMSSQNGLIVDHIVIFEK